MNWGTSSQDLQGDEAYGRAPFSDAAAKGGGAAFDLSGQGLGRRCLLVSALAFSDAVGVLFGVYSVLFLRCYVLGQASQFPAMVRAYLPGHLLLAAVFLAVIFWLHGYRRHWSIVKEFSNVWKAVMALLVFDVLCRLGLSVGASEVDQPWYGAVWLAIFVSVQAWHWSCVGVLMALGLWKLPVVIVGTGENAVRLTAFLAKSRYCGLRVAGFIRIDGDQGLGSTLPAPVADRDWLDHLPNYRDVSGLHLFFAPEPEDLADYTQLVNMTALCGAHCMVVTPAPALPFNSTEVIHFSHYDSLALSVRSAKSMWRRSVKRLFDILGSAALLVLLFPLMLGIAGLIWAWDGSPVIYRQERRGRRGRPFTFLKFRTMYRDADAQLRRWQEENNELYVRYVENNFKLADDPRVIPGGRFLRETSADELPQLINVLLGQMSLVGPRPVLPREVGDYEGGMFYYDLVTPGITGLWQVAGRSETQFVDRARLDRSYVKNWSLWGDLVILLATLHVIALKKGAY